MKYHPFVLTALLLALPLSGGCSKSAPAAKEAAAAPAVAHDDNIVKLTKENLAKVSIKTEPVTRSSLDVILKAVGQVSENRNKTAKVTSTFDGRLTKLNVDLNERVKAGDVLAQVQTPELLGRPLDLKAPIDGSIVERTGTLGELIGRETVVYTISDPDDLWLIAEIKERDIGAIRMGQEAAFSVLAYPAEVFRGRVILIGNRGESASRTLEVRIQVANPDGRLKPGMFADVEITTTAIKDVLVISDQALETMEQGQVVFVAKDAMTFERRTVKTGLELRGRVQVTEGLKEGEKVVTDGSFILKSEMLKGQLGEE